MTLLTPVRAFSVRYYWWEVLGETDALLIHFYTPISDRILRRKWAIVWTWK